MERTQITTQMAAHSGMLKIDGASTLEALSSNPNDESYFRPLPLPPASPEWSHLRHCVAALPAQARGPQSEPLAQGERRRAGPPAPAGPPPRSQHPQSLPPIQRLIDMADAGEQERHLQTQHPRLLRHTPRGMPPPPQQQHLHQSHPGGPYELGSEARIGYRTAWKYGLDRDKWTERARRRWGSI